MSSHSHLHGSIADFVVFLCDPFQPICHPPGLIAEADLPVKSQKSAIAVHEIEANAELEFAETDRTQGERPRIALVQVIRPVQDALEEDAVLQGKHMSRFVDQHFAASPQQEFPIISSPFIPVKGGIIAGEAENSEAFPQGGLTVDEVPRRMGIEVLHGDCQNAKGIGGKSPLEEPQHITGQDLAIFRRRVDTSRERAATHGEGGESDYIHNEVIGGKLLEDLQRWAVAFRKLAQGLQVDLVPVSIWLRGPRLDEIVEGPTRFRMHR